MELKPVDDLEWASAAPGGNIDEPTELMKDGGWTAAKPSLQHFNWWMRQVWIWQKYFLNRTIESDMVTITASGNYSPDKTRSRMMFFNSTAGPQYLVLPALTAGDDDGLTFWVKKIDNTGNNLTFTGTVEGEVNPVMDNQYTGRTIVAYNGLWFWKA